MRKVKCAHRFLTLVAAYIRQRTYESMKPAYKAFGVEMAPPESRPGHCAYCGKQAPKSFVVDSSW
jgi:hypothetical protein